MPGAPVVMKGLQGSTLPSSFRPNYSGASSRPHGTPFGRVDFQPLPFPSFPFFSPSFGPRRQSDGRRAVLGGSLPRLPFFPLFFFFFFPSFLFVSRRRGGKESGGHLGNFFFFFFSLSSPPPLSREGGGSTARRYPPPKDEGLWPLLFFFFPFFPSFSSAGRVRTKTGSLVPEKKTGNLFFPFFFSFFFPPLPPTALLRTFSARRCGGTWHPLFFPPLFSPPPCSPHHPRKDSPEKLSFLLLRVVVFFSPLLGDGE